VPKVIIITDDGRPIAGLNATAMSAGEVSQATLLAVAQAFETETGEEKPASVGELVSAGLIDEVPADPDPEDLPTVASAPPSDQGSVAVKAALGDLSERENASSGDLRDTPETDRKLVRGWLLAHADDDARATQLFSSLSNSEFDEWLTNQGSSASITDWPDPIFWAAHRLVENYHMGQEN
jgi:hypothetical protein